MMRFSYHLHSRRFLAEFDNLATAGCQNVGSRSLSDHFSMPSEPRFIIELHFLTQAEETVRG